jgi:ATP phosphoribosyltransferase
MNNKNLTLALPKGRMLNDIVALFKGAGLDISEILGDSRKLVFDLPQCQVMVVRSSDVIPYVVHGAADAGVVGKDVILEERPNVYEPIDLGLGPCHLSVARLESAKKESYEAAYQKVATSYPHLAEEHFRKKGIQTEIIKLNGAVELAPLVGLTDCIVDLVSSGETLRQNGLVETEKIVESTSRLIVNRAAMKTRTKEILGLVERLKTQLGEEP